MRTQPWIVVGLIMLIGLGCRQAAPANERASPPAPANAAPAGYAAVGVTPCTPVDGVQFICNLVSPEDLAVGPGAEWIITSGNREGGRLHLIDVRQRTSTVLFPTTPRNERFDAATYPICPGPLELKKVDEFRAHGLYLKPSTTGPSHLYVVNHGLRESVEVFEVSLATPPTLTWVGCIPSLSTLVLNGVVGLPDGGVAATSGRTGDVWEYHTATGWRRVPGSEGTAPNGLEVSRDGRWLYIAGWAEEKVTRLSRGQSPVQKDVISLGFRPDNLRMSADGSVMFAAGHTDKNGQSIKDPREPLTETSNVARINPSTLAFERILQHPAMEGFVASTTAIQVGNELWLGSQRGDRVAYLPMSR